jgi:outer membrane protein
VTLFSDQQVVTDIGSSMRNKVFFLSSLIAFVSLFPGLVLAETKIGYFNLVQVIEKAPQAVVALKKLEAEFAPRELEVRSLADKIKVAEEEREKNALVWSDTERRDKEKLLRDQTRNLQRISEEIREDYNIRRNEELGAIQQAVYQAVIEIAQTNSYDLILHEGAVYASPAIDITGKVLEQLNNN